MKILENLPKSIKKVLAIIEFPFVFVWIAICVTIMGVGYGFYWLGDAMTGFRASKIDIFRITKHYNI